MKHHLIVLQICWQVIECPNIMLRKKSALNISVKSEPPPLPFEQYSFLSLFCPGIASLTTWVYALYKFPGVFAPAPHIEWSAERDVQLRIVQLFGLLVDSYDLSIYHISGSNLEFPKSVPLSQSVPLPGQIVTLSEGSRWKFTVGIFFFIKGVS